MFNRDKVIFLMEQKGWSKYKLAKEAKLGQSTVHEILSGKKVSPNANTLAKLAEALGVSVDEFFNETNAETIKSNQNNSETLTKKDKSDIAKELEKTMKLLEDQEGIMFDGEIMDEETKELLRQSLENSMRVAKAVNKKYTPKKYRKSKED